MTYKTQAEGNADKQSLSSLVEALAASPAALRRDECGAWHIQGSRGHACTWGDGETFALYVGSHSARQWGFDKKRLEFGRVTQDGACEGIVRLMSLPRLDQAAAIREVLGIRKRM